VLAKLVVIIGNGLYELTSSNTFFPFNKKEQKQFDGLLRTDAEVASDEKVSKGG
jgi:hypothetical protein